MVWFVVVVLGHNRRVKRALRDYQSLPADVARQALDIIAALAERQPAVTFLRPDVSIPCQEPEIHVRSHVGGVPYAEATSAWPAAAADATADQREIPQFVIQVLLDDPDLPSVWQGRLLQVFMVSDIEQCVVSHANLDPRRYVPLAAPLDPTPCVVLTPIRVPMQQAAQGKRYPASADRLLELSPALGQLLRQHARDPVGLLTQILRPNIYRYELDATDMAYMGGDPRLPTLVHVPACALCQQPMRFLFQFGEIIPEVQLDTAGVCWVFGCDEHPDQLVGYLAAG